MLANTLEFHVRKRTFLFILCLTVSCCHSLFASSRTKELGVVAGTKSKYSNYRASKQNKVEQELKTIAIDYEIIPEDIDIFTPENSAKLHTYKRILIPYYLVILSKSTYAAMKTYVEQGGLLVVRDSLICIEVEEENRGSLSENYTTYSKNNGGNPLVGIYGHAGAAMPRFKITRENPLTTGFKAREWHDIDAVGRYIFSGKRYSQEATAVAVSEVVVKDKKQPKSQPFLTYNGLGNGVCIYLVGRNYKNKHINKLLNNILSEKTLDFFCDQ